MRVDHGKVICLCALPPSAQRVCAAAKAAPVVQTCQIEADTERIIAVRVPVEAPLGRSKGFTRVIAPHSLCDRAGRGLARKNVAGDGGGAKADDAHIDHDRCLAEPLPVARVLALELYDLFAFVAESVFRGNDEFILDLIAFTRRFEFRHLVLLPVAAGNAGKAARFAVQLHAQRGTDAAACDVGFVMLCILAPRANLEVQRLTAGDAGDALQITLDLYLLIAAVLIRDADDKRVFFARAGGFDGKRIFARFAILGQKQRHAASGRCERLCAEIA